MKLEELMSGIQITHPTTLSPSVSDDKRFDAKRTFNLSKSICDKLDETSASIGVNNSVLVRSILKTVLDGIGKLEKNNDKT